MHLKAAVSLTSVTIGNSVQSIGDSAFLQCSNLNFVIIPDSVKSIEDYAFYGCSSLTSVTIPGSVTSIGENAFANCSNLTSVELNNDYVVSSFSSVFSDIKDTITSVTIGKGVQSIGENAFSGCSGLQSITVSGDNVNYKSENDVLFSKDGATLILYPAGKTDTSYSIPDNVQTIENNAFEGCSSLTSVTIPDSVTSIGNNAFANCINLTSVTYNGILEPKFSNSNTVFEGCAVEKVVVPTNYKEETFGGKEIDKTGAKVNLTGTCGDQDDNVRYTFDGETLTISGSGAMFDYSNASDVPWNAYKDSIKSVVIENDVESIGNKAFNGCNNLTSVTIGNGLQSIGNGAFDGCSGLQSINVSESNANYKSEDGVLFSKDGAILILFPARKTDTSYSIPDSVESIGNNAFEGCSSLESVTISDSVQTIGNNAFANCINLTSVTYNGILEPENSGSVFVNCSKLT